MKVTITMEFDNGSDAGERLLHAVLGDMPAKLEPSIADKPTTPVVEPEKPKRKRGRPRKVKEPEPTDEAPADAPSLDDLKTAVRGFIEANDVDAAKAIFAEFGAKRISDLPETAYADVLARLTDGIPF